MLTSILIAVACLGPDPGPSVPATTTAGSLGTLTIPQPNPLPPQNSTEAGNSVAQPRHIFLRYLDRDHDGRLHAAELPQRLQRAFERTDTNADGFLDADEILHAPGKIGQQARKLENLKLDREGQLAARGRGNEILVTTGVRMLHRLDQNGDGFVNQAEIGVAASQPSQTVREAIEVAQEAAVDPGPSLVSTPEPAVPPGEGPSAKAESTTPSTKKTDLPTAPQILENLDRNQDGVVDTSEAVDQLADNFQRLDKDRSGGLDLFEIDRGLRLARLFGIKPKSDPKTYQKPPAAAPAATQLPPSGVNSGGPL